MQQATLRPSALKGSVLPPPSKSAAHRAMICAALAGGVSTLAPIALSEDMQATIGALRTLGARISLRDGLLTVDGSTTFSNINSHIDCGESGSTLRFIIPVAALSGKEMIFTGGGRLPQRPLGPYLDCLPPKGVHCHIGAAGTSLPLTIAGRLQPGRYELPGNLSSQFVTGLLLALPMLDDDSEIVLTSPLQSAAYIDITTEVQGAFGVQIQKTRRGYYIPGGGSYRARDFSIEGDWSQAAFWLCAGALGADVGCLGLSRSSTQGDRAIVDILTQFGAEITKAGGGIRSQARPLHGIRLDASQIPDLVPVIAVVAALSAGQTVIYNAARLRIKESDRLRSVTQMLGALGAQVCETADGLVIDGVRALHGGMIDSCNDHRIVMAAAVAALRAEGEVIIRNSGCIGKSYPDFFEHYQALGGDVHVVDMG